MRRSPTSRSYGNACGSTSEFSTTKAGGTVWVDEADAQLARIEFHFIDDVKFGLGLLASISKNTQMTREWRNLNNEVWVPLHNESLVKARVLLVKGYNERRIDDYADYKKLSASPNSQQNP